LQFPVNGDLEKKTLKLVGGFNPSEKYGFVSWDDDIHNIWKNNSYVPNQQSVNHLQSIQVRQSSPGSARRAGWFLSLVVP
jgi:hypothetical protein